MTVCLTLYFYNTVNRCLNVCTREKSQRSEAEMENGGSEILEPYDHVLVPDSSRPCDKCNCYSEAGGPQRETALRLACTGQRTPSPIPSLHRQVSTVHVVIREIEAIIYKVWVYKSIWQDMCAAISWSPTSKDLLFTMLYGCILHVLNCVCVLSCNLSKVRHDVHVRGAGMPVASGSSEGELVGVHWICLHCQILGVDAKPRIYALIDVAARQLYWRGEEQSATC